jgi:cytoskeletal protein CcmA (bactofilin family)
VDNDGRDDVVVGASFENGSANDAGRAYMFVYRPPVPQGFFLLANEEIEFKHHLYSEGKIHSNRGIEFQTGAPSIHAGNVIAVEDVEIARNNIIEGDITAGGEVENKGTVNGTITQNANVTMQPLPEIATFSPGTDKIKVPHNGAYVLLPGPYGKVDVGNAATLYLSSGEYNLIELDLGTAAMLSIDVSAGPVTVNLVEEIDINPEVTVEITGDNTGFPSARVTFNSLYSRTIKIRKRSVFLGTLNAPYAKVKIQEDAFFKGALSARKIEIEHRVAAVFHASETTPGMAADLAKLNDNDPTVSGLNNLPVEYELSQNYPNPFNPATTIRFALPEASPITLKIYNIHGQLVRTLTNAYHEAGYHQVQWDATNDNGVRVASGYYFYRLQSGDFQQVKKMLLVK